MGPTWALARSGSSTSMGERRDRNPEPDEVTSQAACCCGTVEESVLETIRLRRTRPDTGVPRVQSTARRHTSARSLSGVPRTNGRTASRNSEGLATTAGG